MLATDTTLGTTFFAQALISIAFAVLRKSKKKLRPDAVPVLSVHPTTVQVTIPEKYCIAIFTRRNRALTRIR
jgi:hypothetical protein